MCQKLFREGKGGRKQIHVEELQLPNHPSKEEEKKENSRGGRSMLGNLGKDNLVIKFMPLNLMTNVPKLWREKRK